MDDKSTQINEIELTDDLKLKLFPQEERDIYLEATAKAYKKQIINCEVSNEMLIQALAKDQIYKDAMIKLHGDKGRKMSTIGGRHEIDAVKNQILQNDQTIASSYMAILHIGTIVVRDMIKEGNAEDKSDLTDNSEAKLKDPLPTE